MAHVDLRFAISGRRPTTIAGYRRLIRIHVKPALGGMAIQQITAVDLDRLYAQLTNVGSSGVAARSRG
ncbi:MAG: hypothetical protein ACLPVY_15420 [Acidimicrobiia bacterium]